MGVHAAVTETGKPDRVLLAHGSGGSLSHELVARRVLPCTATSAAPVLDDSAVVRLEGRLAFTTDSYIVQPLFFPGGDIGRLAVCGTVNDLSMVGAEPRHLSLALILEEGFPLEHLDVVMRSIATACGEAGVSIVTGDTKVVNRGKGDGLFINTAGIGMVPDGRSISGSRAQPGDRILISGPLAEHGLAIMAAREGLAFSSEIRSDCAPLNGIVAALLEAVGDAVHCMRDPTRGGLGTTLNELALQSLVAMLVDEPTIPVRPDVRAACEMLGLDPMYVANEGKFVAVVEPSSAAAALQALRSHPLGREATDIGEVVAGKPGRVMMRTQLGPTRLVAMLSGELLPRIC